MLTLALLRHAKSSWTDPTQDDYDRPLNERGIKAAPLAGAALAKAGFVPDLILCSSAVRTRETLALASPAMNLAGATKTVFDEKLYLASPVTMMEFVRDIPQGNTSALLVGHNPGIHALALTLAGKGSTPALESLNARYPTAAVAIFFIDRDRWRDVRSGDGKLELFWTPKMGGVT